MKHVIRLGLNPWRGCSQIGNTCYETTGSSSKISGLHISGGPVWQRNMWVDGNMDSLTVLKFCGFEKHRQNTKQQKMVRWFTWWLLIATVNCCGRCSWNLCQKEEKTCYSVYGHYHSGRFIVIGRPLKFFKATQEIFSFPNTTKITNSQIRSYSCIQLQSWK